MKPSITIGRSSHCDIIVPDDRVSREHARISLVGGEYVYEDLSKNGSVIGGRVIHGRATVAPGAEILLAGRVFHYLGRRSIPCYPLEGLGLLREQQLSVHVAALVLTLSLHLQILWKVLGLAMAY